jgi:hypothetical protein
MAVAETPRCQLAGISHDLRSRRCTRDFPTALTTNDNAIN